MSNQEEQQAAADWLRDRRRAKSRALIREGRKRGAEIITVQFPDGEQISENQTEKDLVESCIAGDEAVIVFRDGAEFRLGYILLVWDYDQPDDEMIADYTANDWTDAVVEAVER